LAKNARYVFVPFPADHSGFTDYPSEWRGSGPHEPLT